MGDQVKQAFQKLKDFWAGLSPKLKKLFVIGTIGLVAIAVGLTVFLNMNATKYVALFPGMERMEAMEVLKIVQDDMGVQAYMDQTGQVLVPSDQESYLIAQLSMQHYPQSTLTYDIFPAGSGLTTTDAEKRELIKQQLQDRLQATFKHYDGVKNAIVSLNIAQGTNRVWESGQPKSTGQVSVSLEKGKTLSPEQVSGMKWAVASSVPNMQPVDVKIIDMATSISLRSLEDEDETGVMGALERLNLERRIEEKYEEKALKVLTLIYGPDEVRVAATVQLDYNKMLTESKKYLPSDQSTNNSGVLEHRDNSQTTQNSSQAQGIPGEEDNTDLPTYNNQQQNGSTVTDSTLSEDYAVSYVLEQIEKDRAELKSATIAVTLLNEIDDLTRQSFITSVSKATNIPEENVSVESFAVAPPTTETSTDTKPVLTPFMILVAGGIFLLLVLVLIISLVIAGKRKKRQMEMLVTAGEEDAVFVGGAEEDAEFNLQQELEERKRQLRELSAKTADDAIAEEVRDFAKNNPEITANLLRAWMKEEIE